MKQITILILGLFILSCSKDEEGNATQNPTTPTYSLSVSISPADAGQVNPSSGDYERNSTVTIQVEPAEGYLFKEWSGDWSGENNPLTLTMDENKNLTANLESFLYIDDNGITIKAIDKAVIGQEYKAPNGIIYKVVDKEMLINMIDNGEDYSKVCTTFIDNMQNMFFRNAVNTPVEYDITSWDVSNVRSMRTMFGETTFNQDISSWDVSSVIDMSEMFGRTPFNQDISSWDVSSVEKMVSMFAYASNFNQDLSSWDVNKVTNCLYFDKDADSWELPKPIFINCSY